MAHILLAIRPAIYGCRSAVLIVLHICHPKRIEYWKIWNEMDGFFFCVSFFFIFPRAHHHHATLPPNIQLTRQRTTSIRITNRIVSSKNSTYHNAEEINSNNEWIQNCQGDAIVCHIVATWESHRTNAGRESKLANVRLDEVFEVKAQIYYACFFFHYSYDSMCVLVGIYHAIYMNTCIEYVYVCAWVSLAEAGVQHSTIIHNINIDEIVNGWMSEPFDFIG